jgi:hypothetical protein
MTSAASAGGRFDRRLPIGSGVSVMCAESTAGRTATNGLPVSSYARQPNIPPIVCRRIGRRCSGAMYAGVPSAMPVMSPRGAALLADVAERLGHAESVTMASPCEGARRV